MPFDPRVVQWVAPAVAKAAIETGVATGEFDESVYHARLRNLRGGSTAIMRKFFRLARRGPRRIVFPEGDDMRILRACEILVDEGIARPILLGRTEAIEGLIAENDIALLPDQYEVI